MAFSTGSRKMSSEINVTPMIDILLVLLIIFMAITPVAPKGLEALIPQSQKPQAEDEAVVLQITRTKTDQITYRINDVVVRRSDLPERLQAVFSMRATKVMFVKADKDLDFGPVVNGIDIAKGAGVDYVGLITPKTGQ
jgi:biopolymer transport protein TolR